MVLAEIKPMIKIPDKTPLAEPIRIPGPGRPWTAHDLWALTGDEKRYELVRGELLMLSPASPVQGRYASRLVDALDNYV